MSEFSHLRNKLLAEQVEDQIYHYILDTPIEPGAKLPNEFALAEKFRVGRSTIREAVKLLSSKGIVEVRRGSGTYVVTTAKGLSDPLNLRSVQDKNALALDLVERRLVTDQLVLTVGYDIENLTDPARRARYHGPVETDRYGRRIPKQAHGSINLDSHTSSTKKIMCAVSELFDRIVDKNLLVRRMYAVSYTHLPLPTTSRV